MSLLRGSQNYVWSTSSVLGKGATGAVYQGVNKLNGEPVAVKTFNQLSQLRPPEVQLREFEVLRKVNHENIVKLLAIEDDQENRNKVIVMELCTGGSLFNILDDPENTYGVPEVEFLKVLGDLTAGMKHLRDNDLVHRDLKPGNIMKFIRDDGKTVYKLTDFGAARELREGQHFQSLYGTEEYLHPDLYERAVLRKSANKTFGATIDLWSIGVTLYHVATGNLPFRPYGGRKNKETMYLITTRKASGVISGIQTTEDGQIEWKRELPELCHLSAGLKRIITPLLAGLLEASPQLIWSFDRFFNEVTEILARKPLDIFDVNRVVLLKVYIAPDEKFDDLCSFVESQTGIRSEDQLFIHKGRLFYVNDTNTATSFPTTDEHTPIFLWNLTDNNVRLQTLPTLPIFEEFPAVVSVDSDAAQAKNACSLGYLYKKRIETMSLYCKLTKDSVNNFVEYVDDELCKLNRTVNELSERMALIKKTAQIFDTAHILANLPAQNFLKELLKTSEKFVGETAKKSGQLFRAHVQDQKLKSDWHEVIRDLKCPWEDAATAKSKTLVDNLRDSWQHLVRDRATRKLSYNDEQFHILERMKIVQTFSRIKNLLDGEVKEEYLHFADALSDWYKIAQTVYLQTAIVKKDVDSYERLLKDYDLELTIKYSEFGENINRILNEKRRGSSGKCTRRIDDKKLKTYLREWNMQNNDVKATIDDNTKLLKDLAGIIDGFCKDT